MASLKSLSPKPEIPHWLTRPDGLGNLRRNEKSRRKEPQHGVDVAF